MRPRSTGVCRLRGEPRQCGDRAHRLIPPSMAPTGERRPSMACLRPIPAPPRLSPIGCPWLRRCRLRHAPPKRRSPRREGRRCKGISSERYMDVPRPRVGAGRGTTRRTKSPCSGGPRPKRSFCPCSGGPRPKRSFCPCSGGPRPKRSFCPCSDRSKERCRRMAQGPAMPGLAPASRSGGCGHRACQLTRSPPGCRPGGPSACPART